LLQEPDGYDLLRRKEDLFDEGIATVFGIKQGEAELQAFCFDRSRFTVKQAQDWLGERGFRPSRFQASGGTDDCSKPARMHGRNRPRIPRRGA
jgi:hypothetical protein